MLTLLRLSIGVVLGLMLWTALAQGQGRPACDQQGQLKTPETVAGEVTKVDATQGKVTVRQSDGVGSRLEAKLREAPNC